MGAHGTLEEALANVKVCHNLHCTPRSVGYSGSKELLVMAQAYHDASTDEDREVAKSKHKKHKKEKKRKRGSDEAPTNGSKKRKKAWSAAPCSGA